MQPISKEWLAFLAETDPKFQKAKKLHGELEDQKLRERLGELKTFVREMPPQNFFCPHMDWKCITDDFALAEKELLREYDKFQSAVKPTPAQDAKLSTDTKTKMKKLLEKLHTFRTDAVSIENKLITWFERHPKPDLSALNKIQELEKKKPPPIELIKEYKIESLENIREYRKKYIDWVRGGLGFMLDL